jgi:hypothetical protein
MQHEHTHTLTLRSMAVPWESMFASDPASDGFSATIRTVTVGDAILYSVTPESGYNTYS